MSELMARSDTVSATRGRTACIYPVQRQELVQVKIAFTLGWAGRRRILRDLRFYCQFVGFDFRMMSEGNFWETRHILTAEGREDQIDALVAYAYRRLHEEGAIEIA
jgi:hypothetical protein